ncbi:maleylpyruvate isomerase family mycothiol-dependent enzyme [Mycobacterium sp. 663a-19]|uniref:maleylpyruvate isomerase family mycothiol-dependent enzyme n=1 Tax=Mycobacterium sp. 663a-19 TaxID=2986148 RepID=UPI002D1F9070|nr:maleylpyruvate isomerase family mycothiol-dependent enzyme [Mycobacterium sp. 663a-19]MEB3980077.1 maleylpyruvate isomerase family mycothiol-dependent enzyme [Mycobacterium sp. 663a-19]
MPPDHARVERWLGSETARLLRTVELLRERDPLEPSALPDWSLGQLLTHIARNADALCNLLQWAKTGIETPMYASTEQRNDDINRGALRSIAIIVDDVVSTARKFDAALRSMTQDDRRQGVRTAQGRSIPASEISWLRLREVVVHHVDLGADFDAIPGDLVGELLNEVAAMLQAKPQWPSIALEATDSAFAVAASGPVVEGTSTQLLGWLTGRSKGSDLRVGPGGLPPLPTWL